MAYADAIYDLVLDVPLGTEDVVADRVETLGGAKVLRDPEDPDEYFYTAEDWHMQVRLRPGVDPEAYRYQLERIWGVRCVQVVERRRNENPN